MEDKSIIKLDLCTKIQYGLFNFFAPIAFVLILAVCFDMYNIFASLLALVSILAGFCCLFINLSGYKKFIHIQDNTITLCKGKITQPKVIAKIKVNELSQEDLNLLIKDFKIKQVNKKIKLLHISPSILGCICFIGPLLPIIFLKRNILHKFFTKKLNELIPEINICKDSKSLSKTNVILSEVFVWGFVLFVSFLGLLGILFAPLYPFMGA